MIIVGVADSRKKNVQCLIQGANVLVVFQAINEEWDTLLYKEIEFTLFKLTRNCLPDDKPVKEANKESSDDFEEFKVMIKSNNGSLLSSEATYHGSATVKYVQKETSTSKRENLNNLGLIKIKGSIEHHNSLNLIQQSDALESH
ncbi:hypothetical protein O9G_003540 [Rozella allomycis CSF55]|uniref:Uncharacterized protein n=1 Tax=Rozella allomycis (strain CSF55) TaxID=988480 RepID=A0A075B0I6_ROZAC|nr:hypothetical protein O9G_003540 [Rozella allomycis CSF55]|eukprot:EPZ35895.1 hypothetical protein O9G_003540 [Rozella allomycis CSF55]